MGSLKKPTSKSSKKADDVQDVEKELLGVVKEEGKTDKESEGEYRFRLCSKVGELDDDAYAKLSQPAREWFEKQTAEINKVLDDNDNLKKDPKLIDFPGKAAAEPAKEDEKKDDKPADKKDDKKADKKAAKKKDEPKAEVKKEEPKKEEPKKKATDKKSEAKKDDKKADKKDEPKAETKKADKKRDVPTESGSAVARLIVCERLGDISLDDLKDEVKKRGGKASDAQIHSVHNVTRRVITALRHVGVRLTPPRTAA